MYKVGLVMIAMHILVVLACFCACFSRLNFDLLYFQQNSYRIKEQVKWIFCHKKRYFYVIILFLNIYCVLLFYYPVSDIICFIVFFVAIFNAFDKEKPIKPLVWTPRVQRLAVTSIVIFVILILGVLNTYYEYVYLSVICMAAPFVILLAKIINSPMENIIKKYYINDAKSIMRDYPNLIVIGITGSYGKTSVKNYLGEMLSLDYNTLITPKNYNTTMGVVLTIRKQLKATHQIFVCEMGARWKGDINEICDIVKPKLVVLTGIAPMHLDTFKTLDTLIDTKLEILKYANKLYFNGDDAQLVKAVEQNVTIPAYSYGVGNVNFRATDLKLDKNGTDFKIGNKKFYTQLIGKSNIENLACSIAIAYSEFNVKNIENIVKRIEPVEHRQELKIIDSSTILIDDAYNSNPVGAKAALETLSFFDDSYKILITPGMIDLGTQQNKENFAFGVNAAGICDEVLFVNNRAIRAIIAGLHSKNFGNYKFFNRMQDAIKYAARKGRLQSKIILIENDLPDKYL
jgi:UDP-N-acetylmuramoyl-tripeptide--D-alanyl-D-alanine ligase